MGGCQMSISIDINKYILTKDDICLVKTSSKGSQLKFY